ncbi:MAG TPA: HNH endonuclease signature motif containing protein, partial [Nocardioidaceae bacterium]|nr:HNH endonuclease signature motif containing protein [Nocardioidaceae bacterium]
RVKRLVSPGIWTALVVRDRHCAFPGCRRKPIACDAHHIVAWADGGPTSLGNLVMLCRKHHTLMHETPWQARINPADGFPEFQPPPGRDGPRDWIRERPPHLLVA